jgi:hypothetical protein
LPSQVRDDAGCLCVNGSKRQQARENRCHGRAKPLAEPPIIPNVKPR